MESASSPRLRRALRGNLADVFRRRASAVVLWLGALAVTCLWGCVRPRQPAADPLADPVLLPPGEGPPDGVELAVYFLRAPPQGGAFAAEFWGRADEDVVAPDVAALWRANGLRLGRAGPEVARRARGETDPGGGSPVERLAVQRLRVAHRASAILAATPPLPRATFLLTLADRRAAARSLAGACAALQVTCRVVDDETAYIELAPKVLQPGRQPEDTQLLDDLTTEVAVKPSQALLVGLGAPLAYTVGRTLLTTGRGGEATERLMVITAHCVCLPKAGAGEKRSG